MNVTKEFNIVVWEGCDAALDGPYDSDEEREDSARKLYNPEDDYVFILSIDRDGTPSLYEYPDGFFDESEADRLDEVQS